ncbi:MAG: hypothetical protein IKP69_07575 [Oscillospiraceae bacterium]|nr:hypothetical protein [Oscillospiraceae bacterium]
MHLKSNFSMTLLTFMMLILFGSAIYFHEQTGQAVLNAGERCITVILPSLYFFSILTAFCVKAGILEYFAYPFQKLFKTNAMLWVVVIFSQIGGYPVGAQLLHNLYQEGKISEAQERNLLNVCMGCGFGFLFATVGKNLKIALWVWLMLSIPNLLLAKYFMRSEKSEWKKMLPDKKYFSVLMTESVESAASAMLKICGMILAFGAGMGILKGIFGQTPEILSSMLEISNLSNYMQHGGNLAIAAGLLSFGGICVHCQLAAVCENHIDWVKFWLCRGLTAGSSMLLMTGSIKFLFPESIPVFLSETEVSFHSSSSMIPSCCLAVMSIFVLKKYDFFQKILTNHKK